MRPEWVTAGAAVSGLLIGGCNLIVTLRTRVALLRSEQKILERVAKDYKRQDVCRADMATMRAECR